MAILMARIILGFIRAFIDVMTGVGPRNHKSSRKNNHKAASHKPNTIPQVEATSRGSRRCCGHTLRRPTGFSIIKKACNIWQEFENNTLFGMREVGQDAATAASAK